jgi:hypothetical protein
MIPLEWNGSLVFAKDSISLSIYDLAYKYTSKHISRSHERDMIKGIQMIYVRNVSTNSENQVYLAHS